jgi:hypothetical protein
MLGAGSNGATAEGSAARTSAWDDNGDTAGNDDGNTAGEAGSEQPDIVELRPEEQVRLLKQQQLAGRTRFIVSHAMKSCLWHGMLMHRMKKSWMKDCGIFHPASLHPAL